MVEKTLDSGAVVQINLAPFGVAHRLLQVVMKEVGSVSMSGGEAEFMKNLLARFVYSPEVEQVLWECMGRCLYRGQKIVKETFEPEAARGDYLLVAKEVLEVNLTPFLKNLSSLLKTKLIENTVSLKSK